MSHRRHHRRRGIGASALAAGLLAVIASGCSVSIGGTELNTDELEDEIRSSVRQRLERTTGISVDCPGDVDAEEGDVFRCALRTPDGQEREVVVRQTDDEGNVR